MNEVDEAAAILAGQTRAIAKLIRQIEDEPPKARQTLKDLFPHTGRARLVGLTGAPGTGKSTLVDRLITLFRGQGLKVGVVAVDPTSPFSGGALLGDRVRMQQHAIDPGVFIRSLATRGAFGGLSPAVRWVVQILDAAGFERIIIETVGVGQDEVDIVRLAHTTLVLTVPGLGDDVQAIKAGILEIADVLVVNKAEKTGAEQTVQHLRSMLELNKFAGRPREWWPPIVRLSALEGWGLDELMAEVEQHQTFLLQERPEILTEKNRLYLKELILDMVKEETVRRALAALDKDEVFQRRLDRVVKRELDPYTVAEELLAE